MNELSIFDLEGNTIDHLTQWDSYQKIIIKGAIFKEAPEVDLCNTKSEFAYGVMSELISEEEIIVEIPNILLTEHLPILIYVYVFNDGDDNYGGKTILSDRLPVREKPKPESYEYADNLEVVNLIKLANDITDLHNTISENESKREGNEEQRKINESERASNEEQRGLNENDRIENEKIRVSNETAREETADASIEKLNEAVSNAETAVSDANKISNQANEIVKEAQELLDTLPNLGDAAIANIANNLTTEESGFVLDARQGKILNDSINTINLKVQDDITEEDIKNIFIETVETEVE